MVKFVTEPACTFIFLRLTKEWFSGIDSENLKISTVSFIHKF